MKKEKRKDIETLKSFMASREIDDSKSQRSPILEKLKAHYPGAKILVSSNNLTAHKEFVMEGVGVAILPEFLVIEEIKNKKLVDVFPNEIFNYKLKIVKRKNAVLSLNALALFDLL